MGKLKIGPLKKQLKTKFSNLPKLILIVALFSLVLLILLLIVLASKVKNQKIENEFFIESNNFKEPSPTPQVNQKIQGLFNEEIPSLEGRWAVIAKDLKTQKTYQYGENELFTSASLYKLTIMWAVFEEIKNGSMNLEDSVGNSTVEDALEAMITISDNETAIAFAEKIGWKNIEDLMKREGIEIDLTSANSPLVSAKSIEYLLERIYLETAVDQNSSQKMKKLLFAQKVNDRIPKYLPPETAVGHKTGELEQIKHNAGIVIGKKSDYIFIFLTETDVPENAAEEIALLAKEIFDALEQEQS